MKDLIERAESALKLILVVSLLIVWACIASWGDPVAIGGRLYSAVKRVPENQRSDSMKNFLRAVDQQKPGENREKLRQVKVDDALAIAKDRGPAAPSTDMPGLNLKLIDETLRELQAACAGITNSPTFGALENLTPAKTRLPFVEQEVDSKNAVAVLAVGMLGPFLYLISLMQAMWSRIKKDPPSDGVCWVFFHPGKLGIILGAVWLCAPAIALLASTCFTPIDRHFRLWCGFALAAVAALPIVMARNLRNEFLKRAKTSSDELAGGPARSCAPVSAPPGT